MRAVDVALALLGLVVLAPVAALAAAGIAAESRGGVLYGARRVGRGGRRFTMWKLRTMHPGRGAAVTGARDPRVTRVGRLLRRTHIDELPQLWNVLRGEMSLVGPRPEDPAFVDGGDPRWQRVLAVRPGITGPTQLAFAARERALLRGRGAAAVYVRDILPAKLDSDARYVAGRSAARDAAILARTLLHALGGFPLGLPGRGT